LHKKSLFIKKIQLWFSSFGDFLKINYCKVANSSLSRLVAHFLIFKRLMKGKFNAYVLWPLAKKFRNWIIDRSTARDFTVFLLLTSTAELLQLNRTQFSSLGNFVSKKIVNQKTNTAFIVSVLSCILGGLSFLNFQLFY
jgi:hypothetical protein